MFFKYLFQEIVWLSFFQYIVRTNYLHLIRSLVEAKDNHSERGRENDKY